MSNVFNTVIVGSGAAGLAAACRLFDAGVTAIAVVTEGLRHGTSINTGSDKQTYYKLGLGGVTPDSPAALAQTLFDGGSMDGDIAWVEAANSTRAFLKLVELGIPFPQDASGAFPGYKTDHDPAARATSCGPYTSREICEAWIRELRLRRIPVYENCRAAAIATVNGRAAGVLAWDHGELHEFRAENVIYAVGGPGALYRNSVYPALQYGGIAPALYAGAAAKNLPESQFGLASVRFRWNVSGSYMQVLPRLISRAADGISDERELTAPELFLKGYQWPFDVRKASDGSSRIDLMVYEETEDKNRRVYLDFTRNPSGFDWTTLPPEAREYLERSGATAATPVERLAQLNPAAIRLYEEHGIHLVAEPLEIAVCFQHNNGGLAGNIWYESPTLPHFFAIGEANGSHGVYRPGGAALNAGQVGALRAGQFIAARYREGTLTGADFDAAFAPCRARWEEFLRGPGFDWRRELSELQRRMSFAGAHLRDGSRLADAVPEAWAQSVRLEAAGGASREEVTVWDLAVTHAAYLDAQLFYVRSGVGSRGSALVPEQPENPVYRTQILESRLHEHHWRPVRPLPRREAWFETAWRDYTAGKIYDHVEL